MSEKESREESNSIEVLESKESSSSVYVISSDSKSEEYIIISSDSQEEQRNQLEQNSFEILDSFQPQGLSTPLSKNPIKKTIDDLTYEQVIDDSIDQAPGEMLASTPMTAKTNGFNLDSTGPNEPSFFHKKVDISSIQYDPFDMSTDDICNE